MEKLKFKFKMLNDEEVDAKGYDLTICENLFGGSIFMLKSGAEIKYLKIKSVRSVLSGKNDIVVTDASDNHIVGIVEDAFDENNVHDCIFVSEIEPDVVKPPKPIDLIGGERSYYTKDTPKLGISGKTKGIVTWSSSDESIASVNSTGKLTFYGVGEVTITVETTSGQSASTTITICEPEPLRLVCDREYNTTQTPTIETENAVGKLSWSSSDENIATIDSDGKITFHDIGSVTFTATTTYDQTASKTIRVLIPSMNASFQSEYFVENENLLESFASVVNDANENISESYNYGISWSSSDESIATIDSDGKITFHKAGNVTFIATAKNGQTSSVSTRVIFPEMEIINNKTEYLKDDVTLLGINNSIGTVNWLSSDESIATVDSSGEVTFVGDGEVTITAETIHGQSASTSITVIQRIKILQDGTAYYTNETPIFGILGKIVGDVTWSSSDESIAIVDSNGKLTFHGVGEVTITVETTHGQSDSITIVVEEEPGNAEEDTPETSDEFTYTKEPGKIKKIFLHLYDGATLESVDVDPASTHSVDGNWDCYIDADGITRLDLNAADDLRKIGDSTFDIVTAFDVDVTAESNLYDSIIEPIITDTNAHAKIFERISHDMETRNVEYTFNEDPTDSSSSRVIISDANDVRNFLHALAYSTRYSYSCGDRNGYYVTDFHVMGSDKVFTSDYYNVDHFDRVSYIDFDIYSNNIGFIIDNVQPDESGGFQGIRIIQKALETGRALDIGVDLNSVGWDAPIIKPRNQ